MPRMARLVVPNYPHHVTQRGIRRQTTFFERSDYQAYLDLLRSLKDAAGVDIWAYCLMPNHVHVVAVPQSENSLAKLFGTAHQRYALRANAKHEWRGHLWQSRFYSFVMDETHLLAAVRYIELNPVRAGLCFRAWDWPWSSVHTYLDDAADPLVTTEPMRELVSDWCNYLSEDCTFEELSSLRKHTATGRPAGDARFLKRLEDLTGRRLRRRRPGPKRKK